MSGIDTLPPTVTVDRAAELLGIGRRQAYEAIRRGEIPAVRLGRRWVVPSSHLLELLGLPAKDYIRVPESDGAT